VALAVLLLLSAAVIPVMGVRPAAARSGPAGGINVEPSMRPWRYLGPNPDGWWCVNPNCFQSADPAAMIDNEITLARNLGVVDIRIEIPWCIVEPQSGSFDWSRADRIFATAATHGVQLQPVLVFTPDWAAGGGGSGCTASSYNAPPSSAAFSAFVGVFMQRYGGQISAVEMWNEPDDGTKHYWSGSEAAYVADILVPGAAAVRNSAHPTVRVEMGGSIGDAAACCTWLDGLYSNGGGNAFDIAAFHNYSNTSAQEAQAYVNDLHSRGQSKPVWLGEYGAQENTTQDSGQQSLMTSVLSGQSALAEAQWYNLRDDDVMTCCPAAVVAGEGMGYYGLVQHDGTTLKAGYSTMQSLLGGTGTPPPPPTTGSPPSSAPPPRTLAPSAVPSQAGTARPPTAPPAASGATSSSSGSTSAAQTNSSSPRVDGVSGLDVSPSPAEARPGAAAVPIQAAAAPGTQTHRVLLVFGLVAAVLLVAGVAGVTVIVRRRAAPP
jgi:hypothetical protein